MKKFFAFLVVAGLFYAATPAVADSLVVQVCGTLPLAYLPGATRVDTVDINGNKCIAGTFSQTGGTISNATSGQATTSTNQGAVAYLYGFNGTTWDQLQVDASKFLKVNCASGCAGGAFNNNADAVATSATNGQSAAWGYFFNGATWDRARGDITNGAWVNVKAAVLPPLAATSTNQGTTADTPCALPASATACSQIATEKAIANAVNSAIPPCATTPCVTTIGNVGADPSAGKGSPSSVAINVSTATTTQLVPISGSTAIYVTSFDVIAGGTGNITFEYGTGVACATGTTALTGAYNLTAQAGIAKGNGTGTVLKVPSGNALCALTSAAVQMSGSVSYQQF